MGKVRMVVIEPGEITLAIERIIVEQITSTFREPGTGRIAMARYGVNRKTLKKELCAIRRRRRSA